MLEDQPWLTWPIDEDAGLAVTATARALADEAAERLIDEGRVQPRGRASLAPTERVLAAVSRSARGRRSRSARSAT